MRMNDIASRVRIRAGRLLAVAALGACLAASPAAAYVVVTIDNQVFEIPSKPEVRGDMVFFSLQGAPVSLRVYEVNVTKTNEFNYLLDRGGDNAAVVQQAKSLRPAQPTDDRIIVSSPVFQEAWYKAERAAHIGHAGNPEARPSLSFADRPGRHEGVGTSMSSFGDEPGRRSATGTSGASGGAFESEAREALAEAKRRVKEKEEPATEPKRHRREREDEDRGTANAPEDAAKAADLDSQIAAEQEHLRKLTSGEEKADDLDREISRSMDKIKRLQDRRSQMGGTTGSSAGSAHPRAQGESAGSTSSAPRARTTSGKLQELQDKLDRLKRQQADIPSDSADEREVNEELIGETQYRIDKLQKKLDRGGGD